MKMEEKKQENKQHEKKEVKEDTVKKTVEPLKQEEKKGIQEEQKKPAEKAEKQKPRKDYAKVSGKDLSISTKQSAAICRFIRGKNPQEAVFMLENVVSQKVAIPFKGEVPHKKNLNRGFSGGKYPLKASGVFIKLLKSLIANAKNNAIDIETLKITLAKANQASRPIKPTRMAYGRKKFKRTHVELEARMFEIKGKGVKEKKKETKNREKTIAKNKTNIN